MDLRRSLSRQQEGFTLIELMVVVLIIAILIAIAIPTFLGQRRRAQDRAGQSNLRNGLVVGKTFYTDNQTYVGFDTADGEAIEPSVTWSDTTAVAGAPTQDEVKIVTGVLSASDLLLVTLSASGTFFCITERSVADGGTGYGQGATYDAVDTVAECNATADW
ncbi:MAG: prepilin-type N-terminal cleavage/methylation domain-containing protein [Actinomycetota bacterium]